MKTKKLIVQIIVLVIIASLVTACIPKKTEGQAALEDSFTIYSQWRYVNTNFGGDIWYDGIYNGSTLTLYNIDGNNMILMFDDVLYNNNRYQIIYNGILNKLSDNLYHFSYSSGTFPRIAGVSFPNEGSFSLKYDPDTGYFINIDEESLAERNYELVGPAGEPPLIQTQAPAAGSAEKTFDYSKILLGDLSEFADIWWATNDGSRMKLTIDDGNLNEGDFINNFFQNEDGGFYWNVGHYDAVTQDGWGYGVFLYPPRVEIILLDYDTGEKYITPSDTTRVRMGTGMEPPSGNGIYYITDEAPAPVWEG